MRNRNLPGGSLGSPRYPTWRAKVGSVPATQGMPSSLLKIKGFAVARPADRTLGLGDLPSGHPTVLPAAFSRTNRRPCRIDGGRCLSLRRIHACFASPRARSRGEPGEMPGSLRPQAGMCAAATAITSRIKAMISTTTRWRVCNFTRVSPLPLPIPALPTRGPVGAAPPSSGL